MIVIDASLAVKWYLDEPLADEAEEVLRAHQGGILVPDIFLTEVTGALVRRANIDKALRQDSEASIGHFANLFAIGLIAIRYMAPADIARAATLAMNVGHPIKDCLYLTLALDERCDFLTCDSRFAAKARQVCEQIRVLGED